MDHRSGLWTAALIALAAGAWGVYWIPQRALAEAGLTGGWATIGQYLVPLALMAPIVPSSSSSMPGR